MTAKGDRGGGTSADARSTSPAWSPPTVGDAAPSAPAAPSTNGNGQHPDPQPDPGEPGPGTDWAAALRIRPLEIPVGEDTIVGGSVNGSAAREESDDAAGIDSGLSRLRAALARVEGARAFTTRRANANATAAEARAERPRPAPDEEQAPVERVEARHDAAPAEVVPEPTPAPVLPIGDSPRARTTGGAVMPTSPVVAAAQSTVTAKPIEEYALRPVTPAAAPATPAPGTGSSPSLPGDRAGAGDDEVRPRSDEAQQRRFDPPPLISMGPATTAMLLGRVLMIGAALLIAIAMRRAVDDPPNDTVTDVAIAAGVVAVIGLMGTMLWAAHLSENGRRLQARVSSGRVAAFTWLVPAAWIAGSTVTYLQIDPDGDFNPFPALAAIGLVITLAVPMSRLQKFYRGTSRRPPIVWWTVYPLDLIVVGALWLRVVTWSGHSAAGDIEALDLSTLIAFASVGGLVAAALIYGWLAARGTQAVFERLGRLEMRHRVAADTGPSWFHSGFRPNATPSVVETRPLIDLTLLDITVVVAHGALGLGLLAWSVLTARVALDADGGFFAAAVGAATGDIERLESWQMALVAAVAGVLVLQGIWALLTGFNAARVTVHAGPAAGFAAMFLPAPALVIAGLLSEGTTARVMVAAGLVLGGIAIARLNLSAMAVARRIGGDASGLGLWTWLVVVALLLVVPQFLWLQPDTGRHGLLAVSAAVQGVLVLGGAIIGAGALRSFGAGLAAHPRVRRSSTLSPQP